MICFPLDNTEYEANALGAWCATRTRGVFAADTHFAVSSNGDMTVTVGPGLAWLKADEYWGVHAFEANAQTLVIDTADGSLERIDAVCVRLDKNANVGELVIKKGAYDPQPPVVEPPARNLDYDEIYVATVLIRAGATAILASDISDERLNESYCGVMRDGVTGLPTQELYDAWKGWFDALKIASGGTYDDFVAYVDALKASGDAQYAGLCAYMEAFKQRSEADFDAWFAGVKDVLDGDTAGNLLNLIQGNTARVDATDNAVAAHQSTAVGSEAGAHGLRYHAGELQYGGTGAWTTIETGSEVAEPGITDTPRLVNLSRRQAVLAAANWAGEAAPYTYELSVPGSRADGSNDVDIWFAPGAGNPAGAWSAARITGGAQGDDTVTLIAAGDKPGVDMPVIIRLVG